MKTILTLLLVCIYSLCFAFTDTCSYYIINHSTDTTYFATGQLLFDCDYGRTIEKSHNLCKLSIADSLYTGHIKIHMIKDDSTILELNGYFVNGLIFNATQICFSPEGSPLLTGQFVNNWKVGFWTIYNESGGIESIDKFISGFDHAVETWEYNENGKIVYYWLETF